MEEMVALRSPSPHLWRGGQGVRATKTSEHVVFPGLAPGVTRGWELTEDVVHSDSEPG